MASAAITFDHLGTAEQMAALLEVVARHGVFATFFLTGERVASHPHAVGLLQDAGHEVGVHGWAHEVWSDLDAVSEQEILERCRETIGSGLGFRAPGGGRAPSTAKALHELGYAYDASLGDGMHPARLDSDLVNVPFVWPGVDGYWYLRDEPADPAVVRDAWFAALDKAIAKDGVFLTICHPEITGVDDDRLAALDAVVERAARDDRVECVTVGVIAARIPA